ncbi:type II secretion system minor pseudopilin GspK [Pseudomonas sp. HK3]
MRLHNHNKQSGLALITVLFIFALVSMLAIGMQQRQTMDIAQASVTFTQTQAQLLMLSAEDIAKAGLSFDLQRDIKSSEEWDTASELWNQPFPTQIDGAKFFVTVRDLQGLFNLNSLAPKAPNPTAALSRLQRLIVEIDPQISSTVAINIKEWLTVGHSNNFDYQNLTPPYRASEIEFTHPSELKLVKDMDIETYNKLEPYITALPAITALNINTTTKEILSSWDPLLTSSDADMLVKKTHSGQCGKDRNVALYKDIKAFWQTPEIEKVTNKTTNPSGSGQWAEADFTVKSQYFSVLIRIEFNGRDLVSESIIRRKPSSNNDSGFIGVIYRDLSRTVEDIDRLKIVDC